MGTKSLTITEEAYERLKAHKREGESFTETIMRMTGDDRDIMAGFGAWAGEGLGDAVEGASEERAQQFEERQDELFGQ